MDSNGREEQNEGQASQTPAKYRKIMTKLRQERHDPSTMTCKELLGTCTFESFSESLQIVVNTISLRAGAEPSGSSKYIACIFPGDIDCCEDIVYPPSVSKEQAAAMLAARIKDMMRRIMLHRGIFLSEFKAGFDIRIRSLLRHVRSEGLGIPKRWAKDDLLAELQNREASNAVHPDNIEKIRTAANATPACLEDNAASDAWLHLEMTIRSLSRVRWTGSGKDISKGVITLHGGVEKTLEEAVGEESMVKIDVWAPFTDRCGFFKYTEVTNVFIASRAPSVECTTPEQLEPLTKLPQPKDPMKRLEAIDCDIRHYSEAGHAQSFIKVIKRMWLKLDVWHQYRSQNVTTPFNIREEQAEEALRAIYTFFSTSECVLAQVHDESEVVRKVAKFVLAETMNDDRRSELVNQLMEQVIGFKKRIKSALGNEAMLTKDLADLPNLASKVAHGELIEIKGFPEDLDKLLDPIWDECPATLHWWEWHVPHEKCWRVGGRVVWAEFVDLLDANLSKLEEQLASSVNEGAKRWITNHLPVLSPVYKDIADLVER